jgi:stalled ribosome alternative rescue factor ArfA
MSSKVNVAAIALKSPLFRKRVVRSRKGKGSYDRKKKLNSC